jgi:hypothetical protein
MDMAHLHGREFSLSVAIEYQRPVLLSDAGLDSAAKALVSSLCGGYMNPTEVSLSKSNDLFSYTFSAPMFNSAASIIVDAQGITVSFKQGKTKEHLDLMVNLIIAALKVLKVARTVISFTLHAVFQSPSDYDTHMERYTALAKDVSSGGTVLVTRVPEVDGELRYVSEKSRVYPNAMFFAVNAVCTVEVTAELFALLASRFEATAALEGLSFPKPLPGPSAD